jgi:hypothetical protein
MTHSCNAAKTSESLRQAQHMKGSQRRDEIRLLETRDFGAGWPV